MTGGECVSASTQKDAERRHPESTSRSQTSWAPAYENFSGEQPSTATRIALSKLLAAGAQLQTLVVDEGFCADASGRERLVRRSTPCTGLSASGDHAPGRLAHLPDAHRRDQDRSWSQIMIMRLILA
jgi:hypothetical protein